MIWSKVTLEQFSQVRELLANTDNDVDRMIGLIRIMEGEPEKSIMEIDMEDLKKKARKWLPLFDTTPEGKLKKTVTLNGKRYYFELNPEKLSTGQYIDVMTFMKRTQGKDELLWGEMRNILASMSVPMRRTWRGWIKEKYDGKIKERAEEFKALPISFVYPLSAFFLNLWNACMISYLQFLTDRAGVELDTLKDLLKSGDGLPPSTHSQIQTLIESAKLNHGKLADSLSQWHTTKTSKMKSGEYKSR